MENPILTAISEADAANGEGWLPEKLISADSHVTEPPHCYVDYIDPAFRDRAPRVVQNAEGGDSFYIEGEKKPVPLSIIAAAGISPREINLAGRKFADLHRGGWDPAARLADQDRDGVIAEVIYPSVGMVLCGHPDPDFKQACMWAYNRWLSDEFIAPAGGRLIGIGQTAVRTVDEAVSDLHMFKQMGFRGVMLPGNPSTREDYDDPSFDPLWRTAVELEMPVSFHILTSNADAGTISNSDKGAASVAARRGPPQNAPQQLLKSVQDIIGIFIWGRIFERHPDLKLVCVEADAGWAPHFSYRMDHLYNRHRFWQKTSDMSKMPSEYFADNVRLTFQDDAVALSIADRFGAGQLLWANDFPHSDSTWPWSRDLLRGLTAGMSREMIEGVLGDNTAALYHIDVDSL